jgi:hypothetical protein
MATVTKLEITYKSPTGRYTIPKGTECKPATNLPDKALYWVEPWEGMSEGDESWIRNYGFLVTADEVEEV